MNDKKWEQYEQTATYLLDKLATHFGLERVEGKQSLHGQKSDTDWVVDAKGVRDGSGAIVIVECRRTKGRQAQSKLAALAFQVSDIGAAGGIMVSPVPLQAGAKKVAQSANIVHVQLDANSTSRDFAMQFLKKIFVGVSATANARATATPKVDRQCVRCTNRFEPVADENTCPSCEYR